MANEARRRKIAERVAEELAVLFQRDVEDPRIQALIVTGAVVDRELAFATVFVASIEDDPDVEQIIRGLEHASGYFRSKLAAKIAMRSFPRLRFKYDMSMSQGTHIDDLLAKIKREDGDITEDESNG